MELEKIKRKIADGYTDEEIANMAGVTVKFVEGLRNPAPKPVVKKPVIKKKED